MSAPDPSESQSRPDNIEYGHSGDDRKLLPKLSIAEWATFAVLAALLGAANIYTTLLIGWGDTGSIVAVIGAVMLLGLFSKKKVPVQTLNLGQTMASAGGSVGFALASYAAVYIVDKDFRPSTAELIPLFIVMGTLGALVGSSVRRYMVKYYFPSGTACAVIQTSVARNLQPGEINRPVRLLTIWGSIAALLTVPTKIALEKGAGALWPEFSPKKYFYGLRFPPEGWGLGIGVDPLYYGIGLVVGPRVGLGMLMGSLAVPFLIVEPYDWASLPDSPGDWVKWIAIAVLTLPTFAAILFAYYFKQPSVVPSGFEPGRTQYNVPALRPFVYGMLGVVSAGVIALLGQSVFGLPWHATAITIAVAWPLCVVNGRVAGDTDINPVRLVAIALLSGFFWLISTELVPTERALAMLGMAVVGGTLAATAVDMMQDYRTGYLVDANPTHQTTVQLFGTVIGALAGVPTLQILLDRLGIGEGSSLPAPGAQIWATMAEAMTGGFDPSSDLKVAIGVASVLGSVYAFLTVWPKTARFMPSVFGIGIGMLLGIPASAAIFIGGLIKWVVTIFYTEEKSGDEAATAANDAGNDTMLAGASIFAAGALLSILLVLFTTLFDVINWHPFYIAGH